MLNQHIKSTRFHQSNFLDGLPLPHHRCKAGSSTSSLSNVLFVCTYHLGFGVKSRKISRQIQELQTDGFFGSRTCPRSASPLAARASPCCLPCHTHQQVDSDKVKCTYVVGVQTPACACLVRVCACGLSCIWLTYSIAVSSPAPR